MTDDDHRKRAPGQPADHPDWFWSLSGGIDSTAALLVTLDALKSDRKGGNFAKAAVGVYLDTRIGVPLNRLYVEQLTDWAGVLLSTWRTDESFREWLESEGAPGAGAHENVRREVKDRQVSKLTTLADKPVYVLGLATDESDTRAEYPKVREMRRHVEVYPVHRTTRKQRAEIILRSDVPRNPLWTIPDIPTDCACLANGDPSELDALLDHFPQFGSRLKEWEESITHEGLKGTLGWDGLTANEKSAKRDGMEQATISMCTGAESCSLERDPAVVRAFKADARGATLDESLSILYEEETI